MIDLTDQADVKAMYMETLDLVIKASVKEWLHLPACTYIGTGHPILQHSGWRLGYYQTFGVDP